MPDSKTKKPFEGSRTPPSPRYNTKGKYPRGPYDRRATQNKRPQPRGCRSQSVDVVSRIEAWGADKKNAAAVKEIKGLFKFAAQAGLRVTRQDMEELLAQLCITPPVSISEMIDYWKQKHLA